MQMERSSFGIQSGHKICLYSDEATLSYSKSILQVATKDSWRLNTWAEAMHCKNVYSYQDFKSLNFAQYLEIFIYRIEWKFTLGYPKFYKKCNKIQEKSIEKKNNNPYHAIKKLIKNLL